MTEPIVEPVVTPAAGGVVEPVVTPVVTPVVEPATPATPVTPTAFFGADGVLNKGWQGTLEEDLREDKSLLSFKSVGDLAKSFVNTKKMVGANVVAIPTDASTEGEWQEFHKAGGRPDTVADYNLGVPEGFPEEIKAQAFPDGRLDKWQERFFKGGVSKKAADAFIAEFAQDILADYKSMQQVEELAATELASGLATDWGAAYEQKKHLGNIAMNEAATSIVGGKPVINEEFKARLVQKAGNDPDIIRAFANLGEKFAEGKPPSFAAIPTPGDLQDQIDELRANPLLTKGTQPERMKLANKLKVLYELKNPEPVVT